MYRVHPTKWVDGVIMARRVPKFRPHRLREQSVARLSQCRRFFASGERGERTRQVLSPKDHNGGVTPQIAIYQHHRSQPDLRPPVGAPRPLRQASRNLGARQPRGLARLLLSTRKGGVRLRKAAHGNRARGCEIVYLRTRRGRRARRLCCRALGMACQYLPTCQHRP
jgi:hypothetical protein